MFKPDKITLKTIQLIGNNKFFDEFRVATGGVFSDIFVEALAYMIVSSYVAHTLSVKGSVRTKYKRNASSFIKNRDKSKLYLSFVKWNKVNQLHLIECLRADESSMFLNEKLISIDDRIEKMVNLLPKFMGPVVDADYFIEMRKQRFKKIRDIDSMGIGYVEIAKIDGVVRRSVVPKLVQFHSKKIASFTPTSNKVDTLTLDKVGTVIKKEYSDYENHLYTQYIDKAYRNIGADPSNWSETKEMEHSQGPMSYLDKIYRIRNADEFAR